MGARGEQVIETPDGKIRILFTNFALASAEKRLDKSALGVARELIDGRPAIGDVVELLRTGMEAANRESGDRRSVPAREAYQVVDTVGLVTVVAAVTEAMTAVLIYRGDSPPQPPKGGSDDPNL
jgi:hypothetical protein